MSFENQIIYLSLHFFHHNFRGYFRISLINELINLNRSIYYKKYIKSINKIIKYFSIKKYFNLTDQLLREKYENYIFLENNLQTKLNNKKFYLTFQNEGSKIFSGISRYFNCLKYSNSGLAKKAFVLFHPLFLIKIIFYFLENVFPKLKSFSFLKNQKIH